MNNLFLHYHWTLDNIVMVLLGMLLVELFRIAGRQAAPSVPRTRFNPRLWFSQTNNWLSPLITFISSFVSLALMDGLKPAGVPDLLYAFGAGVAGQAMIKVAIKGIRGTFGSNGRAK